MYYTNTVGEIVSCLGISISIPELAFSNSGKYELPIQKTLISLYSPKHKGYVYVNSSIPIHSWPISRRPPAFGYHMFVKRLIFAIPRPEN